MFQTDRLIQRIKVDEGFRSGPYKCSMGVWTIGYGTTIYRDKPVTEFTVPISIRSARLHLKAEVLDCIDHCQYIYGERFPELHSVHQEILICLAYQVGRRGLINFKKMNRGIQAYDMVVFHDELKDSLLFNQATSRIKRYLQAINEEKWPS